MPWTRGATSGALLLILGAWAAIVPFIGPYLNLAYTPAVNTAWHWTAERGWFEVAPGAAAFAGGLLLLASRNRAVTIAGSWLGIAAGAWLIVGPSLAGVLDMNIGTPDPSLSTNRQALAELAYFYAVGALILFFAAAALGRLSVQSIRDVATAEQRAARAETTATETTATETAATETAGAATTATETAGAETAATETAGAETARAESSPGSLGAPEALEAPDAPGAPGAPGAPTAQHPEEPPFPWASRREPPYPPPESGSE